MTGTAVVERALQTGGESADPIYQTAAEMLRARRARGVLADVGCGIGRFRGFVPDIATEYVGVDVVRHSTFPADARFAGADLDREAIPIPSATADVVVSIETIEHLENPRALVREMTRILKPGGWLLVTTPNQISVLSLLCLIVRGRFAAFQDGYYPVHRTALLPVDLLRIAGECGLLKIELGFTCSGRIPLTTAHYPPAIARLLPQAFSDHVLLVAQRDERLASHG
jgi:SAM-dependent methyltransferase